MVTNILAVIGAVHLAVDLIVFIGIGIAIYGTKEMEDYYDDRD